MYIRSISAREFAFTLSNYLISQSSTHSFHCTRKHCNWCISIFLYDTSHEKSAQFLIFQQLLYINWKNGVNTKHRTVLLTIVSNEIICKKDVGAKFIPRYQSSCPNGFYHIFIGPFAVLCIYFVFNWLIMKIWTPFWPSGQPVQPTTQKAFLSLATYPSVQLIRFKSALRNIMNTSVLPF